MWSVSSPVFPSVLVTYRRRKLTGRISGAGRPASTGRPHMPTHCSGLTPSQGTHYPRPTHHPQPRPCPQPLWGQDVPGTLQQPGSACWPVSLLLFNPSRTGSHSYANEGVICKIIYLRPTWNNQTNESVMEVNSARQQCQGLSRPVVVTAADTHGRTVVMCLWPYVTSVTCNFLSHYLTPLEAWERLPNAKTILGKTFFLYLFYAHSRGQGRRV